MWDCSRLETRRTRVVCLVVAVAMGALQAWSARHSMNADGISYLDMGDAYSRGDWANAINGMWSPFYAWLLGLAEIAIRHSARWEFGAAHLVNFAVYLWAIGAFNFFLKELIDFNKTRSAADSEAEIGLSEVAWTILGYTLFIWSSLYWVGLQNLTPDLLVEAIVFIAAGMCLRIHRRDAGWLSFLGFGLLLGVGYLSKTAMLPLGLVFLVTGAVSREAGGGVMSRFKRSAPGLVCALVGFLLLAAPYVAALSKSKGRLTPGDSGKINYAWYVGLVTYRHWQGETPGAGTPVHPTRRLSDVPAIYEFAEPVGGTYPFWYDPSYWYEGVKVRLDLRRQVEVFAYNWKNYLSTLFDLRGSLIIGLLILLYVGDRGWSVARELMRQWRLIVPALGALALYSAVHVEERYIAPFLVLLFCSAFSVVRLLDSMESRRLITGVILVVVAMLALAVAPATFQQARTAMGDLIKGREAQGFLDWRIAEGLRHMGVNPGDKVGSLEYSNQFNARWARLARVRIAAEIYGGGEDEFWRSDPQIRSRAISTFAAAGVKLIVARKFAGGADSAGWEPIEDTGCYVYFLQ